MLEILLVLLQEQSLPVAAVSWDSGTREPIFVGSLTSEQLQEAQTISTQLLQNLPKLEEFKEAIKADETINIIAKIECIKLFSLLDVYIFDKELLQGTWTSLKQTYSSSWLTQDIVTAVENYASVYNIWLVAN